MIAVHDGKSFNQFEVMPEMIGHYVGEYALTRKRVSSWWSRRRCYKVKQVCSVEVIHMALTDYSREFDKETTARAQGHELHVSPKHCVELCRELRGMDLAEAKSYLRAVIKKKKVVRFKRYNGV